MNNGTNSSSDELRHEVTGGLLYCHSRLNANTNKLLESSSFLYALVELLAGQGLIEISALDAKKREVAARLLTMPRDCSHPAARSWSRPEPIRRTRWRRCLRRAA